MTLKFVYVNNVRVAESTGCDGAVSITVYMPGGVIQEMLLAPGDYIDLMDALGTFNEIAGQRK